MKRRRSSSFRSIKAVLAKLADDVVLTYSAFVLIVGTSVPTFLVDSVCTLYPTQRNRAAEQKFAQGILAEVTTRLREPTRKRMKYEQRLVSRLDLLHGGRRTQIMTMFEHG